MSDNLRLTIVDTIGIGDTELSEQEVLYRIADACWAVKDGFHQIFFVTSGRMTEEELMCFDLLRTVIFDNNVCDYITIIRTKFQNFMDVNECQMDISLMKMNKTIDKVITAVGGKLIHIENRPPHSNSIHSTKEQDMSRNKVMTHLYYKCSQLYNPPELQSITERIKDHKARDEILKGQIEAISQQVKEAYDTIESLKKQNAFTANQLLVLQDQNQQTKEEIQQLQAQIWEKILQHERDNDTLVVQLSTLKQEKDIKEREISLNLDEYKAKLLKVAADSIHCPRLIKLTKRCSLM
eukprot:gene12157-14226_t